MPTIYTSKGVKRFETPINKGSQRVFKIMGDDYVTLKFSVASPIYFKLGDYVDIQGFGRFELVTPYQPNHNTATNGYDYELRLDAQHMKWRNKIMRYLPQIGGAECAWVLTATADVHMEQVLANIEALSTETLMTGAKVINQQYLYNGATKWAINIDSTVEASAKTISYDNTNIIDQFISRYHAFCKILSKEKIDLTIELTENDFAFKETYYLLYTSCSQYSEYNGRLARFVLKLVEPDPTNRGMITMKQ